MNVLLNDKLGGNLQIGGTQVKAIEGWIAISSKKVWRIGKEPYLRSVLLK